MSLTGIFADAFTHWLHTGDVCSARLVTLCVISEVALHFSAIVGRNLFSV